MGTSCRFRLLHGIHLASSHGTVGIQGFRGLPMTCTELFLFSSFSQSGRVTSGCFWMLHMVVPTNVGLLFGSPDNKAQRSLWFIYWAANLRKHPYPHGPHTSGTARALNDVENRSSNFNAMSLRELAAVLKEVFGLFPVLLLQLSLLPTSAIIIVMMAIIIFLLPLFGLLLLFLLVVSYYDFHVCYDCCYYRHCSYSTTSSICSVPSYGSPFIWEFLNITRHVHFKKLIHPLGAAGGH